ncbi:uncharacterized protein EV422DRAFT_622878 [Fimicolochytrium jonesii]|uniref:uncharacterized protein n=1 Tax=Fimicolochytrium jonesii TaxID=1396493 RepID=UPI0022FE15BA|nr:uncharacterized protein EV422DRAFT_622878 [Fimicolochytrium jonesii]KAI8817203.1 hypothetical protein EV422DRAFT_622878 [Fimicolochytrium jonesii]
MEGASVKSMLDHPDDKIHPYLLDKGHHHLSFVEGRSSSSSSHRGMRKNRSDGALRVGLKATAHAVQYGLKEVAHNFKDTVVSPVRASFSHGGHGHGHDGHGNDLQVAGSSPSSATDVTAASGVVENVTTTATTTSLSAVGQLLDKYGDDAENANARSWPRSNNKQRASTAGPTVSTFPRLSVASHSGESRDSRSRARGNPSTTSTKDIKRFVKTFPELSSSGETLINTYACALERDGLWHGKLYLTNAHLCFYGKHFGRSAKAVVAYSALTGLERKNTAGMFPNAIRLTAEPDQKFVFGSFLKRESAYDEIMDFWEVAQSEELAAATSVRSDLNESAASSGEIPRGSKTANIEFFEDAAHDTAATEDSGDGYWIPSEDSHDMSLPASPAEPDVAPSEVAEKLTVGPTLAGPSQVFRPSNSESDLTALGEELPASPISGHGIKNRNHRARTIAHGMIRKILPSKCSDPNMATTPGAASPSDPANGSTISSTLSRAATVAIPATGTPRESTTVVSRPQTPKVQTQHIPSVAQPKRTDSKGVASTPSIQESVSARSNVPVSCNCIQHFDFQTMDATLDLNVEKLFDVLFGGDGSELVRQAHASRETVDVMFGPWALDDNKQPKTRDLTYLVSFKPPMMAKQTTGASEKQTVMRYDPLNAYIVETAVRTPKAPYGEYFTNVNRWCLTHAGRERSRLFVTTKVDFAKRLMWKSQIENATVDGVKAFNAELLTRLRQIGKTNVIPASSDSKTGKVGNSEPSKTAPPSSADLPPVSDAPKDAQPSKSNGPPPTASERLTAALQRTISRIVELFSNIPSINLHSDKHGWTPLFFLVLLMVVMTAGVAITLHNVREMASIEVRLEKTMLALETLQVGKGEHPGQAGDASDPWSQADETEYQRERTILLQRTKMQIANMHANVRDAQIRAVGLGERLAGFADQLSAVSRAVNSMSHVAVFPANVSPKESDAKLATVVVQPGTQATSADNITDSPIQPNVEHVDTPQAKPPLP